MSVVDVVRETVTVGGGVSVGEGVIRAVFVRVTRAESVCDWSFESDPLIVVVVEADSEAEAESVCVADAVVVGEKVGTTEYVSDQSEDSVRERDTSDERLVDTIGVTEAVSDDVEVHEGDARLGLPVSVADTVADAVAVALLAVNVVSFERLAVMTGVGDRSGICESVI